MWHSFITAFSFLSRVPVPQVTVNNRTLGGAVAFFPLVGLVIGGLLFGVATLATPFVSPLGTAFLITGMWAWLTGGLHLDGLADTFDGLSGGRGDRARTLEIMRDSRIGTHGAVALVLLLIGKVTFTAELVGTQAQVLCLVPAAARAAVVPAIACFPYARPDGLGRAMRDNAQRSGILISQLFLLATLLWVGFEQWPRVAAAFIATAATSLWLSRKLGGLTGDTYGACIELAELAALAFAI
ncbi:MAG: adenosylcobinamide-GDP ribazoletransferase [Deltaproteobacteria bacterium]|nr:adenosylcobinamide-GDP ribazoletransferase [Deltaproteobacteria bacterium]